MSKSIISTRKRGEIWHYSFTTPSGKRVRRSSGSSDEQKAKELAAREYNEYWRVEKLKEKPDHTWQEAVLVWLNEKPERKENKNMLYGLVWLDGYLRDKKLVEIDRNMINFIKNEKQATGVKNRTINATLQQIRVVLRCAVENEMLDKLPPIKMLPEPRRRIRWLSPNEANRLLNELPDHLLPIVVFALATGLRMSNVTGIKWANIDVVNRIAYVHSDESKTDINMGIPLNSDAMDALLSQRGKHREMVFTYNGKPVKNAGSTAWKNAMKRAGIKDFRFHDLRHTWATRHTMSGTPESVLQELGGWKKADTVRKYAHLSARFLQHHAETVATSGTNLAQSFLQ